MQGFGTNQPITVAPQDWSSESLLYYWLIERSSQRPSPTLALYSSGSPALHYWIGILEQVCIVQAHGHVNGSEEQSVSSRMSDWSHSPENNSRDTPLVFLVYVFMYPILFIEVTH